jgi:hypothetical protein
MTFSKTVRRTLAGGVLAGAAFFVLPGCDFTYENPNATDANAVLTSADGLTSLAAGMRREYTVGGLSAAVRTSALATRQFTTVVGFLSPQDIENGQIEGDNTIINEIWNNMYQVVDMADQIVANADNAGGLEDELLATAYFYRAAALGTLAMFYEQFPIDIDRQGQQSEFVSREDGLRRALDLLEQARQARGGAEPSDAFKARAYGTTQFFLGNTIDAYSARFALMLGQNEQAAQFAQAALSGGEPVSLFPYDPSDPNDNPLWGETNDADPTLRAVVNFGFDPDRFQVDSTDGRLDFYLGDVPTAEENPTFVRAGLVSGYEVRFVRGFYDEQGEAIPAYIPDEMRLIRAEAFARRGQTAQAVDALNQVRTDTDDPLGIEAGLSAYSGPTDERALLDEIFRQRRLELFATGLGLEDARRLGQPAPPASPSFESFNRVRNFLPYPEDERNVNANTPADPSV